MKRRWRNEYFITLTLTKFTANKCSHQGCGRGNTASEFAITTNTSSSLSNKNMFEQIMWFFLDIVCWPFITEDIWLSFDAEQWWWKIWPNGQENGEMANCLIDKVSRLSLKINFLHIEGCLTWYISRAHVILTLWRKNCFRDVCITANICSSRNVCSEIAESSQNVHMVHYHIDECWTDQRFWKVLADDILRNKFSTLNYNLSWFLAKDTSDWPDTVILRAICRESWGRKNNSTCDFDWMKSLPRNKVR